MKVLFLCHRFPYPPRRGGKIRPFNIIRHLAARGCEVTVLSLARDAQEAHEAQGIAPYCKEFVAAPVNRVAAWLRMLLRLPSTEPSSFGYFRSRVLARAVRRLLASTRFDLIFVHCSSVASYVAGEEGTLKILDFGDMDSQKWLEYSASKSFPLSLGYWLEGRKLERRERTLAAQFDLCTCTTRAELATLQSFEAHTPTGWFPNGVDSDYFAPAAEPYERDLFAFVGRMDYFPNQQAVVALCREVLPRVREQRPEARCMLVGANPSREIQALGEIPGVTVTGSVPDVRPYVRRAALTVANLRIARGTQNKILESMAMGVPVVASPNAAAGVDAVPGTHLLVADNAADTARCVLQILESPAERERLAGAGRERVLTHHAWPQSMKRVDDLISQCVARAHGDARYPQPAGRYT